jgi:hypothetical protein
MTTQKHISYSACIANKRSDVKLVFTIYNKQPAEDDNKRADDFKNIWQVSKE